LAAQALEQNDTYHALEKVGALLKTGPTGTNVCDLQVLLLE
jgi:hydroxypyruvate reductase